MAIVILRTLEWTYDAAGTKLTKTVTTDHLEVNVNPIFSKEYQADFTGLNHKINIVDLSKGIYFLHLLDENEYLIQKIIVQ